MQCNEKKATGSVKQKNCSAKRRCESMSLFFAAN